MNEEIHFDVNAFAKLTDNDPEFQRELVGLFRTDTRERIDSLRALVADRESERAMRQAHTVKGSAGNLCAVRLHALALELERTDPAAEPRKAERLVDELDREYETLMAIFAEHGMAMEEGGYAGA